MIEIDYRRLKGAVKRKPGITGVAIYSMVVRPLSSGVPTNLGSQTRQPHATTTLLLTLFVLYEHPSAIGFNNFNGKKVRAFRPAVCGASA